MTNIIKQLIDLLMLFINEFSKWKIDIGDGLQVPVLHLALSFTAFIYILYFIMRGLGFFDKGDD